jgi:hypothetical protein
VRLKLKNSVPVLATEPTDCPDSASVLRQSKGLRAVGGFGRSESENVKSLAKYRSGSKKYQASLTFSGEASTVMGELMTRLDVDNPNDVVLRGIAILVSAQGKEILLRDLETGAVEAVEV